MKLKSKIIINPDIDNHEVYMNFLSDLPFEFQYSNDIIFNGRNTLKRFNIAFDNGNMQEIIVKKYKKPDIIKSFIYGFFRKSKAFRAFHNGIKLEKRGIDTPIPIAYLEQYKFGFLRSAYFISFPIYNEPIESQLEKPRGFNKKIATDFAYFASKLHRKGILHLDFNKTNVLWKDIDKNKSHFSLIDNNRMVFFSKDKLIPIDICLKNLCFFTGNLELHYFVAKHYIIYRKLDNPEQILERAINIKKKHDKNNARVKKFKRIFKRTFKIKY